MADTKSITDAYYQGWVRSDRDAVRSLLADDLLFRSPEDDFDAADEFLDACWKFAEGFDAFTVEHAVYAEDGAYVVYTFGDFACGELLKIENGKISEIFVTFNPTF
jgi:ketosteroid isomerase-like protein